MNKYRYNCIFLFNSLHCHWISSACYRWLPYKHKDKYIVQTQIHIKTKKYKYIFLFTSLQCHWISRANWYYADTTTAVYGAGPNIRQRQCNQCNAMQSQASAYCCCAMGRTMWSTSQPDVRWLFKYLWQCIYWVTHTRALYVHCACAPCICWAYMRPFYTSTSPSSSC